MDTISSLKAIVARARMPEELMGRIMFALDALPIGSQWDRQRPPLTAVRPEEAADVLLGLYQTSPYQLVPSRMTVVFRDCGEDFNYSLSREIGRLLPDLLRKFTETEEAIFLRNCLAPQVIASARAFLVNHTDIGEVFALTAAKNVWSALYRLVACLHYDWLPGLQATVPLIEMMSRAIPLFYCRKQSTWLVQRLV